MGTFLGPGVTSLLHLELNVAVSVTALLDLSRPSGWKGRRMERRHPLPGVGRKRAGGTGEETGGRGAVTANSPPVSSGLSGLVLERQATWSQKKSKEYLVLYMPKCCLEGHVRNC